MIKLICTTLIIIGGLIVVGTAGADCDGKCMQNSMSLGEIAQWISIGMAMIGLGAMGLYSASK